MTLKFIPVITILYLEMILSFILTEVRILDILEALLIRTIWLTAYTD